LIPVKYGSFFGAEEQAPSETTKAAKAKRTKPDKFRFI
jgi:hypothetical protein